MSRSYHLTRLGERMAYREFGDGPDCLICVHGLYRNGHDFDVLAGFLADRFRVIVPDMIGRGDSDYAADKARYNIAEYVEDVLELARGLGLSGYHYLGTSMGGLVGMSLAARADSGVRRLVLNDVGPEVALATLKEIGQRSLDAPAFFASYAAAEAYLAQAFQAWGPLPTERLAHLIRHSVKERDGRWVFRYDRELITGFRWPPDDLDLWPLYRAFRGPVLVLRGERSDVLTADTAARLAAEPGTRVLTVPGAAHAPPLMTELELTAIRDFLSGPAYS